MPAVTPSATAPQNSTRKAPLRIEAPPRRPASAPSTASSTRVTTVIATDSLPPLLLAWLWRGDRLSVAITVVTLVLLAVLGALAGRLGGASMRKGALRVLFWGAVALGVTAGIGHLFGVSTA